MKKLKISFFIISLTILSGCFQTTALLGPGITVVTSGNVLQAGLQYGANTAIKRETGKYPLTHLKDKVEEKNKKKHFYAEFKSLVENQIQQTRQKLFLN